ncbi:hypothetical protein CRYUN_Cryun23aG0120700 [Craigia yunnanensis]
MDTHRTSQREAILTKFLLKRKDRCFEKKVRYQSPGKEWQCSVPDSSERDIPEFKISGKRICDCISNVSLFYEYERLMFHEICPCLLRCKRVGAKGRNKRGETVISIAESEVIS